MGDDCLLRISLLQRWLQRCWRRLASEMLPQARRFKLTSRAFLGVPMATVTTKSGDGICWAVQTSLCSCRGLLLPAPLPAALERRFQKVIYRCDDKTHIWTDRQAPWTSTSHRRRRRAVFSVQWSRATSLPDVSPSSIDFQPQTSKPNAVLFPSCRRHTAPPLSDIDTVDTRIDDEKVRFPFRSFFVMQSDHPAAVLQFSETAIEVSTSSWKGHKLSNLACL